LWDPGIISGSIIVIKVAILLYIAAFFLLQVLNNDSNTDLFIKIKRLKAITNDNFFLSLVIL